MKAVVDFIQGHGNVKSVISIHSYSQMLLFPYGYKRGPAAHHQELVRWPQNVDMGLEPPALLEESGWIIAGLSLLSLDATCTLKLITWFSEGGRLQDVCQKLRVFWGKARPEGVGNDAGL